MPTPTTPLPWSVLDNTGPGRNLVHVETDCDHPAPGRPVCSIPKARKADAEYLVEAANAYPTLKAERDEAVALLRELLETECPNRQYVRGHPSGSKAEKFLAKWEAR